MKTSLTYIVAIVFAVSFFSCGSSKDSSKSKAVPMDGVEQVIPLSGPEYWTNDQYYRAVKEGVSPNTSMAQKVAMQNARQALAAAVQADVKTVIENYDSNRNLQNQETNLAEMQGKYQELVYTIVDQQLLDARVVGEKLFKLPDNTYKYFVCLQMDKAKLEDRIINTLSKDKKIAQDFDLELFKKIYNEKKGDFQKTNQ